MDLKQQVEGIVRRREFLRQAATTAAAVLAAPTVILASDGTEQAAGAATPERTRHTDKSKGSRTMAHTLPDLPYGYDALQPYIDEQTMRLHHGKHHAAYVNNLNTALAGHADLAAKSIEEILAGIDKVPADIRQTVINNGGGHANHALFWQIMAPPGKGGGGEPGGRLAEAIKGTFGDTARFKEAVSKAAMGRFGSGWAWLTVDQSHKLRVYSTANQDSPIMEGQKPILGLDVWEHAYYLKYQNRRAEYVEAWWNVVNWAAVAERFEKAG